MFHNNPITYHNSHIKYKICFDSALGLTSQDKAHFRSTVKSILDDDNGWKKYGFDFAVGKKDGVDLYIELASPEKIYNTCHFAGLSCYDPTVVGEPPHIYIHIGNWNGGSKSSLPLDKYRYYAINHEIGHFLGLNHPEKDSRCGPDGIAYVMNQMSLGPGAIYPCVYENYLP